MNIYLRLCLGLIFSVFLAAARGETELGVIGKQLSAGWQIEEADGSGDIYYFYPDGLFVRQGVRRREFVAIGHWSLSKTQVLTLFDVELRNTTTSKEQLAKVKAEKHPYNIAFENDGRMRWDPGSGPAAVRSLRRIRELPDRTENVYWGLGTEDDYERAIRRERGLPPKGP